MFNTIAAPIEWCPLCRENHIRGNHLRNCFGLRELLIKQKLPQQVSKKTFEEWLEFTKVKLNYPGYESKYDIKTNTLTLKYLNK